MIETSTTQRVNLVNAAALAKARGITVVERKNPMPAAYAAQLTPVRRERRRGDHRRAGPWPPASRGSPA